MLSKKSILLAFGIAMVAVPTAGFAKGGFKHMPTFEQLDADKNGEITKEEMTAFRASRFAAADSNNDGVLSRDELIAQGKKHGDKRVERHVDRMLSKLDKNDDGSLSKDELAKRGEKAERRGERMFEKLDADDSGTISQAEFEKAKKWHRKKGRHHGEDN